ncbi:MAG TPA: 4Fe-4S ferredoxin [Prolixibacteraceae bacterium]|nr:4Fe-4S ferredoxin [Prolixibacteraceae bacterium]
MSINRRNFFKTVGVAGLTLTGLESLGSPAEAARENDTEFYGFLYDSTICIGCRACEKACAKAHGFPEPEDDAEVGVVRKTSITQRSVINKYETSQGEMLVRHACMHCNEPACASACLTQAMYKTKEGPVIWRADKCMGCRYCMISCPFDVPKFDFQSSNPIIQKCDMCFDRVQNGEIPVCAETCGDALFFGTRRELIAEAHRRISESPDSYIPQIFGEKTAGGTSSLYLSPVPFDEVGLNTKVSNESYPAKTKGFLYSVPSVFILLPSLLLGMHEATKSKQPKNHEND